jgi:MFS family permease
VSLTRRGEPTPRILAPRLVPLQLGVGLQGVLLWVPVEKLFMSQIGFTPASVGVMAAAYAAVVPLLEVPSGILADRSSRRWLMVLASLALAASSLVGGLSTTVGSYIGAAIILGVYFALNSGTVDSVVYDTVLEETGSSHLYERLVGRVRVNESVGLVISALAGGLLAEWTSARFTYFATIPFTLLSIVAFLRFAEPQLHRSTDPEPWRRHVATTFRVMTRQAAVRRVMLLAALAALLSQAVFEFGPLWLVAGGAPAALYGPYWAALVSTLGVGGYLSSKLSMERRRSVVAVQSSSSPHLSRLRSAAPSLWPSRPRLCWPCCSRSSASMQVSWCTMPSPQPSGPGCPLASAPCPGCCSCPSRSSSGGWPGRTGPTGPAGSWSRSPPPSL